jgi:PhzF family phenazine biosynthesis protein
MTDLPIYVVDAFAERPFAGNPAAVVPLEAWLPDARLQQIAAQNNLSETAFLVPSGDGTADYDLRWFTPTVEVRLCGHATLASGFVLMACLGRADEAVRFASRSGPLAVARDGDRYTLDFPARPPQPADGVAAVAEALGAAPQALLQDDMNLAVFAREAEVAALAPDMAAVAALPGDGVIATAPGDASGVDFVSRYFVPGSGIPEDPVTGSAHTLLAPYWAERLGRTELSARQISARGGDLTCHVAGDRVHIGGRCRLYLEGRIHV